MRRFAILAILLATFLSATLTRGQTYTVLHTFTGLDGNSPLAGLFRDSAGNLYGTTFYGGAFGSGTVFKIDTSNNETVLHSFAGGTDGANPYGTVIRDSAGNLYGTTMAGGSPVCQCGTVFKLSSGGMETVMYRFRGGTDGAIPMSRLIRDSAGNLYGTTSSGGYNNYGTVFKLNTRGKESVLYRFRNGEAGSLHPGVIRDSAGDLYGTASGRVFKLDASNHFSLLAPEVGGSLGDLSFCFSGEICGTDFEASVWRITKSGENFIILYDFPTYYDGSMLEGGVVQNAAGDLFGVASCCGQGDSGVIYEVTNAGVGKTLYAFDGDAGGAYPQGNLVLDKDGNVFGTTSAGGDLNCAGFAYGCGVVYKFTP